MVRLGMSIGGGERRDEELTLARSLGYDAVEISMDGTRMVFGGRLHPEILRAALTDFGRYEFWYSVHSPSSLDLRDRANRNAQMALATATLRFAHDVGARVLVIHFEQRSPSPEDETAFVEAIRRLSDDAGDVLLGIENIEVERIEPVIECVRRVDRANVVMTLDIGHAYLAAAQFKFDLFQAIAQAAPLVRHVHMNDNFGRYDPLRLENFTLYRTQTPADTFPLGKGDLHLPVGWGEIPLDAVFGLLSDFQGTVIHEYRYQLFLPYAESAARAARRLVGLSGKSGPEPRAGREDPV
jgi:sugar phosphate isomerase/epimerase